MRRRLTVLLPLLALALAASGCDTTDDSTVDLSTVGVFPTSILVEPSSFLGDIPCSTAEGAMQSYVATLLDVTDINAQIALPSSVPLTCTATVVFREVLKGRVYRVHIDGYDVPATALVPLGGPSSGARSMVLRSDPTGATVKPRWSTSCADIEARKDVRSSAGGCLPFTPHPSTTGIAVDPRATLTGTGASPSLDLRCTETTVSPNGPPLVTGDVASFDILPADPALPPLLNLPCTSQAPVTYTQGITPGAKYKFRIEARAEDGGPIVWGSSCSTVAIGGLITNAVCDTLDADGALDVSLADLLDASGKTCTDAGIVTYDAEVGAPADVVAQGVACEKPVRFSPIAPGTYAATLVGRDANGSARVSATCTAEIAPGAVTVASCTLVP